MKYIIITLLSLQFSSINSFGLPSNEHLISGSIGSYHPSSVFYSGLLETDIINEAENECLKNKQKVNSIYDLIIKFESEYKIELYPLKTLISISGEQNTVGAFKIWNAKVNCK